MTTSAQRLRPLLTLLRALPKEGAFITLADQAADSFDKLAEVSGAIAAATGTDTSTATSNFWRELDRLGAAVRGHSPSDVYADLYGLRAVLFAGLNDPITHATRRTLADLVVRFVNEYDTFNRDHSRLSAYKLAVVAKQTVLALSTVRATVQEAQDWLLNTSAPPEDYARLNLELDVEVSVEDAVRRVDALKTVYGYLCQLYHVSSEEYPLDIERLEVGSLGILALGKRVVVNALKALLPRAWELYQRNTLEGRTLTGININKGLSEMAKAMEEAGEPPDPEMLENIRAHGLGVSRQALQTLMEGVSEMVLDGNVYVLVENQWVLTSAERRSLPRPPRQLPRRSANDSEPPKPDAGNAAEDESDDPSVG